MAVEKPHEMAHIGGRSSIEAGDEIGRQKPMLGERKENGADAFSDAEGRWERVVRN